MPKMKHGVFPSPKARFTLTAYAIILLILAAWTVAIIGYIYSKDYFSPESRLKRQIKALPIGTPRTQIESMLKQSNVEPDYWIPTKSDTDKNGLLFKSKIPLSEVGGLITAKTDVRQTVSCVSYSVMFVFILDKNNNLIKSIDTETCIERVF